MKILHDIRLGRASVHKYFWLYGVLGFLLVIVGGYFVISRLFNPGIFHWSIAAYLLFSVLFYLMLFVGLVRSAGHHIQQGGNVQLASIYQALGLLGALGLFYLSLDAVQLGTEDYTPLSRPYSAVERETYKLGLATNKQTIVIKGIINLGITKSLRRLLDENKTVEKIILQSDGGHIYAARGVAKLILEHQIDTHVDTACSSACVVVFAAGSKRSLAEGGKLGFHQYTFDTGKSLPFNVQDEQQKETIFYLERGVSKTFLDEIFSVPFTQLWQPKAEELLQSGLVHVILPAS
ncbi:MAG: hypothetical protein ACI9J2_000149 [Saprospiraceae bacterium]